MLKLACASSEVSKKLVLLSITAPDKVNSRHSSCPFGDLTWAKLDLIVLRDFEFSDGRLVLALAKKNLAR